MIINAIHVYSNNVKRFELHLDRSSPTDSYIIEASSGLDAQEIQPRFYSTSSIYKYFDLKVPSREIALKIRLNPQFGSGESYSSLRDTVYRAMSASRTGLVQLRFMNGTTTVAAISGFPKKLEAELFSKDPNIQLTIGCDDGFLYGLTRTEVSVVGLDTSTPTLTDNVSTAPHGFRFTMTCIASKTAFTIRDTTGDWEWVLPYAFNVGDILHFGSEAGNQYVYRVRSSAVLQLADRLNAGAVWPIMFPGANDFVITTSGGSVGFTWGGISYATTFWGV